MVRYKQEVRVTDFDPNNLEPAENEWVKNRQRLASLVASPDGRRQFALRKPEFFDTYYCDMIAAPHRTGWFRTIDEAGAEARQGGRKMGVLFLAPRNHGKSEAAVTIILRAICMDRNVRILLVGESQTQAVKRLSRVKALMESPKIVEDWCSEPERGLKPFRTDTSKWTESQITVDRDRISIDPTVTAVGTGGAITGGHFDLVIFDDVESPESASTANKRRETRDWMTGTVWPTLERGGVLVAIGTRKHADDLYQHMKEHPFFQVIEDPAIYRIDPETGARVAYIPVHHVHTKLIKNKEIIDYIECNDPEARVLWSDPNIPDDSPLVRDLNFLLSERFSMGPAQFAREYQHEVIDDETALVRMEWLKRAMDRGKHLCLYEVPHAVDQDGDSTGVPFDPVVVTAWDLALTTDKRRAEELNRDFSVGTTWLLDRNTGTRYLVGLKRFRGVGPESLVQNVVNEYKFFCDLGMPPVQVRVEHNAFAELYYSSLAGSGLPLMAHVTHGANKNDAVTGVASIRAILDKSRVVLPTRDIKSQELVQALIEEVYLLGRTKHDDIVMSWWIAETALRATKSESSVVPPKRQGFLSNEPEPAQAANMLDALRPKTFDWSNYQRPKTDRRGLRR